MTFGALDAWALDEDCGWFDIVIHVTLSAKKVLLVACV